MRQGEVIGPNGIVAAAGLLAFVALAWALLSRAGALFLPAYDTAFFQQIVWNVGHGRGFTSTFFPANFLGLHFEPLLVVPALLERLWPDPRLLGLLTALGIAATAPAAYLLLGALADGRRWAAAALAAPIPLWPALQQAARAGFHTEVLALPLILLAGWAGLRGRWWLCWPLAVAGLAAKEDQAYAVAVIGLLLALHGPSRRQGIALTGAAIVWGAAVEWAVMPLLRGPVVSQLDNYYHWLHGAAPGQVAAALAHPAGWLALAAMVACLAGLPLLRPWWLVLVLPPVAGDLLSAHQPQPDLRLQYALPLVVPLLVAAGLGLRRLPAEFPAAVLALPALLLGALAVPTLVQPSLAGAPSLSCATAVPASAPVAADDGVAEFLASRPELRLLPDARATDWVVVDRLTLQPSYVSQPDRGRIVVALPSQGRAVRCDDGRFQVWGPAGG